MTSKTLNGIYTTTYYLTAPVTRLTIAASGYLAGGLQAMGTGRYSVINKGEIAGAIYGVNLAGGGSVTNTGTIQSTSKTGVAGVVLGDGGVVTNGSAVATRALITGNNGVGI